MSLPPEGSSIRRTPASLSDASMSSSLTTTSRPTRGQFTAAVRVSSTNARATLTLHRPRCAASRDLAAAPRLTGTTTAHCTDTRQSCLMGRCLLTGQSSTASLGWKRARSPERTTVSNRKMNRALRFLRFVLRPILMLLTKRDWRGAENFPDGGFVLVANHISHLDPFTFAHFCIDHGIPPRYLAKATVLDLPVVGRLFRSTGQSPVYRGTATAAGAYSAAVEAVNDGACIIIYPEGTITRDQNLWPMGGKTGAARVALATGRPVVPAAQWGAHEVLAPYAHRVSLYPRKTVHVRAGPPVDLDDLRGQPPTAELL